MVKEWLKKLLEGLCLVKDQLGLKSQLLVGLFLKLKGLSGMNLIILNKICQNILEDQGKLLDIRGFIKRGHTIVEELSQCTSLLPIMKSLQPLIRLLKLLLFENQQLLLLNSILRLEVILILKLWDSFLMIILASQKSMLLIVICTIDLLLSKSSSGLFLISSL